MYLTGPLLRIRVSFIRIVDIEFDMLFVEAVISVFSKIDTVYEELRVAVVVFIVEHLMEHLVLYV